jgi:hypothetical protein
MIECPIRIHGRLTLDGKWKLGTKKKDAQTFPYNHARGDVAAFSSARRDLLLPYKDDIIKD